MRRLLLILFFITLTISSLNAKDERKRLTLNDCIAIARENSPLKKSAENMYESRKLRYIAFKADYLPQISLSGSAPGLERAINSITQPDGSTLFLPQSQLYSSARLSLTQKLPWTGGEINLYSSLNRLDLIGDNETFYWRANPVQISLSQPLFKVNTMMWDNEIEKLRYENSHKQYYEEMENLSIEITQKFFDYYIAQMNVKNAELNAESNDTLYKLSVNRFGVGIIAENDLLQSELAMLNSRNTLETARLNMNKAAEDLKIAMGLHFDGELELVPPEKVPYIEIDPDKVIEIAKNNRSDYVSYKIQQLEADKSVEVAESNNSFNATISASLGLNQRAMNVPDSYKDLLDQESFNVSFSIPLFQWGKGAAEVESAISYQKSVNVSIDNDKRNFELSLKYQALNFNQLQKQVQIAAKADTIAQKRFEVARNRYMIVKLDLDAFFIAQNETDNAFASNIQMQKSYWLAYYTLRRLTLYDFEKNEPIVY